MKEFYLFLNDRIPEIFNLQYSMLNRALNPNTLNPHPERHMMTASFFLNPVGIVGKGNGRTWIEVYGEFADGLLGLDKFSHIFVLFWFHQNDTPEKRRTLQVHPRKDPRNPLTGVFATHSPQRPNLIGLTLCRILSMEGHNIYIEDIDAVEGSPVVDIKCYIPGSPADVRVPDWVEK